MVVDWRAANRCIVQFWYRLDDVAQGIAARLQGRDASCARRSARKISFTASQGAQRDLSPDHAPAVAAGDFTTATPGSCRTSKRHDSIVYDGVDPYTKKWGDGPDLGLEAGRERYAGHGARRDRRGGAQGGRERAWAIWCSPSTTNWCSKSTRASRSCRRAGFRSRSIDARAGLWTCRSRPRAW